MTIKSAVLLCWLVPVIHAVTIGQTDSFEDGSTMGWFVPSLTHPSPPTNISTDGPAGAGDNYLQLTATGEAGAGGRMAVLNESQWTGNYLTSGITHITMHVRNFGPADLFLRLLFEAFPAAPGPPDNLALSADAVFVPAGSDWIAISFPVTAAALVGGGLGTVEGALMDVDTLRIFHNPLPEFGGPGAGPPQVNAVLGVDNITAAAIPEPSTWFLAAAGLAMLLVRRCHRL